jgi:Short C-terminal domain
VVGEAPVSNTAPAPNSARVDSLERLAALRDRGAITNEEYQAEKTHVMNNNT